MDVAQLTLILAGLAAGIGTLGFTVVGLVMLSGPMGYDYMMERRGMITKMFGGAFLVAGAAWIVSLVLP